MKYFVESLPRSCSYCDCCHTKEYDSRHKLDGEKFCGIENEDVEVFYYYGDGRPDWCPLKELPKKRKELSIEEYEFGKLGLAFTDGWNACLRKILGE